MRKIDPDVKLMSERALRREVMRLRAAFRAELAHTGNRRCWVTLMAALPEYGRLRPLGLSRGTFLGNCARYFDRNAGTRRARVSSPPRAGRGLLDSSCGRN
jgi:hypothetical protein